MMNRDELKQVVAEAIQNMNAYDVVRMHNEYCYEMSSEDVVFHMSEMEDVFYGKSFLDVIDSLADDFCARDDFFYLDSMGRWNSTNDIWEVIDADELADFIVDEDNALYNSTIRSILNNYEEEEEEDLEEAEA